LISIILRFIIVLIIFKKYSKDSAVFQLLEDHENYGVYEHNPNECNWNVFYKTLPPVSYLSYKKNFRKLKITILIAILLWFTVS